MSELDAVDLLRIDNYINIFEKVLLTKNGQYLYSLSSLKELVIPTLSKNMSWVVVSLQFSISRRTKLYTNCEKKESKGLTIFVKDGVTSHGHNEKLRNHLGCFKDFLI